MFAAQLHPMLHLESWTNKRGGGDRQDTDIGLVTLFEKASSVTFIMMNLKLDFYFTFYV